MSDMFSMVEEMAAQKADEWIPVGDRARVRGKHTICQYGTPPNVDYALFGSGPEMLAHGKSFRGMMEEADKR